MAPIRIIAALLTAGALAGGTALAAPERLDWQDLIPAGEAASVTRGIVQHGDITAPPRSPAEQAMREFLGDQPGLSGFTGNSGTVRQELDGRDVTMRGYLLPIAFEGMSVTEFLLVPFIGACIHVPAPPPNQIVFVTAAEGLEVAGLYDAVEVTGRLTVVPLSTDYAEVGYQMSEADVMLVPR